MSDTEMDDEDTLSQQQDAPTNPPDPIYIVCCLEIPQVNAWSAAHAQHSLSFNGNQVLQKWTHIVWAGSDEETAQVEMLNEAKARRKRSNIPLFMRPVEKELGWDDKEVRLYRAKSALPSEIVGKVYIDGPVKVSTLDNQDLQRLKM